MRTYYIIYLILISSVLTNASFAGERATSKLYPFIENRGQWHLNVKFKTDFASSSIFFEKNAFHYQFFSPKKSHHQDTLESTKEGVHAIKASFLGANENVKLSSANRSSYYLNYYKGNDPNKWKNNVHAYKEILYRDLYQGIDLKVYQSDQGSLKYDYILKAGVDPDQIQVEYKGANNVELNDGALNIEHEFGHLIEKKPLAYQKINNRIVNIPCEFTLDESGIISFHFPEGYDHKYELVIDPVLVFSTYSGATATNFGMTATYDQNGNGYMGGTIFSNNYTNSTGYFQSSYQGGDADIVISKFNSTTGGQLLFSTYLGGNESEAVNTMVVSDQNELVILGVSSSSDYPVSTNAYKGLKSNSVRVNLNASYGQDYISGNDMVITKFNPTGTALVGSTFFGGNSSDGLNFNPSNINSHNSKLNFNYGDHFRGEIVTDSLGDIYIGSSTHSFDIDSTLNSFSGSQDGIIAKFSSDLSQLRWSRYLGGSLEDAIYSLKVIDSNKVLVGGGTVSLSNFPVTSGSYRENATGSLAEGFIAIISSDGSRIEKSTFIGTSNYDQVYFIEYDRYNHIYAFGQSRGGLFPVKNSTTADNQAGQFIVKLDPNLDSLELSHTFGNGLGSGTINISPTAFLVDRCLNMYVSGWGGSLVSEGFKSLPANMPLQDEFRNTTDGNDFYLYVLNRNADSVIFASFFGGTLTDDHVDGGTSRFDKNGVIYQSACASCFNSDRDFPTTAGSFSQIQSSDAICNNALFKYDFEVVPVANFTADTNNFCLKGGDTILVNIENKSIRADNTIWDFYGTIVNSDFSDTTIAITQPGRYRIKQVVQDTVCVIGNFFTRTIVARPDNIVLNPMPDTLICYSDSLMLKAFNNNTANRFTWSKNESFSNPFPQKDSAINIKLDPGLTTYYVKAQNTITNACEKIDSIKVRYIPVFSSTSISADTICENTTVSLSSSIVNVDSYLWDFDNGDTDTTSLNHQINYTNSGDFSIKFIVENNQCGIQDTTILPLSVQANNLLIDSISDTLSCGLDTLKLIQNSNGTAKSFLWSSSSNFNDTLNNFPRDSSIEIFQEGLQTYFIKISDDYCSKTDEVDAELVRYNLELQAVTDSVCTPYSTKLGTTIIGTDSFRIVYGNGNVTKTDSTPIINYSNKGKYIIQLIGSNAKCNIRDTLRDTINVFQNVELTTAISDTMICSGDTISLSTSSKGVAKKFIWDNSPDFMNPLNLPTDSTIKVFPSQDLTYFVKGENEICFDQDTVNVSTEEVIVDLDDVLSICLEDTINIQAIIINSINPLSFSWNPTDSIISGAMSDLIRIAPKQDLEFTLETTSSIGCKDFDTTLVEVERPAFTDAIITTSNDSAFKGEVIQLNTNRNGSNLVYNWEPRETMDNPGSANPRSTPQQTTTFKVTITDLNTGCVVEAFKRVKVFEINCTEPDIFVPTAFTPNGDGNNDIFYVRGANLSEIDLKLYNRWGELIFETQDKLKGWNGRYKGREADPGVFVYHLKATCLDGQEFFKKGNISLIR